MNETKSMNESYPRAVFSGDIITVTKDQEIPKALERLMESDAHILGFDTETKPAFKKGESYRVSLISSQRIKWPFYLGCITYMSLHKLKRFLKMKTSLRLVSPFAMISNHFNNSLNLPRMPLSN